jgi:RHS repeat-associated protein
LKFFDVYCKIEAEIKNLKISKSRVRYFVGTRKKPIETSMYYCKSRYYVPEWGRFLTPDSFEYLDPTSIIGLNLFAYCSNDPINKYDPTGHFWDTIFDILFIGWDIYNLCVNDGYKDWKNWVALGADIAFAAIPFVTGGGGQVVKVANVADDFMDIKKITVIGETMDRVKDTAMMLDCLDNLYDGFKYYGKLSNLGKGGKVLAEFGGKASNIAWLYGKLRSGYRVIDIGIDSTRLIRSSSYIAERIALEIWKSRNIWKWVYHFDF